MSEETQPHPAQEEITDEEWLDIWTMLNAVAYARVKKLTGNAKFVLDGGITAEDLAMKVFVDVRIGKRGWDPDINGDILVHMIGQLRSVISNAHTKAHVEREVPDAVLDPGQDNDETTNRVRAIATDKSADGHHTAQTSPNADDSAHDNILIDAEARIHHEQLVDLLYDIALESGDPMFVDIIDAFLDETMPDYKPRHMAARLGISEREYESHWRALRDIVKREIPKEERRI